MGGVNAQVGIGTTSPDNDLDVQSSDANKTAIDIVCTGGGDPKINFQLVNATTTFSMGIDNSDSDKFKIGTSALETNTRLTINSSGYVGIGTTSPLGPLHVVGTGCASNAERGVSNFYYNSSDCAGGFSGYHARGTEASPTTVQNGDFLSGTWMGGYDGTSYISTSYILAKVNGTVATGSIPTDIVFETGSTATNAGEKMRLTSAGRLGIGNSAPTATLDVDGSAIFNESSNAKDFRIESDANTHHFYVDGTNNEIGVNTSTPTSTLDIQGSLGYKFNTITAATTLNQTHNVVLCNTGPYTVTLPAAASNAGKTYYIKNIDAQGDIITLDGNASETIDGNTTYLLNVSNHALRIICDGSNWYVLEETYKILGQSGGTNCDGSVFSWNDVSNPTTGKTWMDRNLGATQVATSSADANSYGDLYQWGRLKDGHQCRTSSTTATTSTTDVPGNATFITSAGDWRSTQNDNLWQGVSGVNNPCPSGYRLPTETEAGAEIASWSPQNQAGAFASPLKFPSAGLRSGTNGLVSNGASDGLYWSSTVSGTNSRDWGFDSGAVGFNTHIRANGYAVRCIKN